MNIFFVTLVTGIVAFMPLDIPKIQTEVKEVKQVISFDNVVVSDRQLLKYS